MKQDVMITGWFICDGQSILTGIVCMRYPRSQKKCSAKGEDCEGRPIARVDVAVPGRWIGDWIRGWISGAAIGLADEPAQGSWMESHREKAGLDWRSMVTFFLRSLHAVGDSLVIGLG